jgi:phage terminase large subunit
VQTLEIECAEAFEPLLSPARYKAALGGRGSGKSHFFAELLIAECVMKPGTRAVCIREVQKSLKESAKRLIEDKLLQMGLGEAAGFRITKEQIETPGQGVIIFQGMQDHTAESIKSLEGYRIAWVEEAQTLSARSLALLRPTIRAEDSQLWFSWNPRRASDPVDQMFRGNVLPTGAVVVKANWDANPWFPSVLEQERKDCLEATPEQYGHIWSGEYATVLEGAYYAKFIAEAKQQGRIDGNVAKDPLMQVRAFWDIGGTGAKADACSIWIAQFVGREIRVLDYYEAQGQPLAAHVDWLRSQGYASAHCVLPHDGSTNDRVHDVSFESALRQAGFSVEVIANQGKGAARSRIEAGRRLFNACWFDKRTAPGVAALGWYHEKRNADRNVGLGPDHDWSSHAADAFGLMCIAYEAPREAKKVRKVMAGAQGWMG